MADAPPTSSPQRSASETSKPSEASTTPKRTFTLPSGEPLTVVQVPTPTPSAATAASPESSKVKKIDDVAMAAADSRKQETTETTKSTSDGGSTTQITDTRTTISDDGKATRTTETQTTVTKSIAEDQKPDLLAPKPASQAVPVSPEPKVKLMPAATMPVSPTTSEPPKAVLLPTGVEQKKLEIVDKPAMVVEKRSSMPVVMPSMQVVEERPAKIVPPPVRVQEKPAPLALTPAPVPQLTQAVRYVGTLEPLKRRIAIFSQYVVLSSTTLRFSNKLHDELLDQAGHVIFHLRNKHELCDERDTPIACIHKSFCLSRWHVETANHQTRILTAQRKQRGTAMHLTIQNAVSGRSEKLVYLRGRLYDGIDPTINKVAVMFEREGVVQVAKGFDAGIAAILAFVVYAWDWKGAQYCCL